MTDEEYLKELCIDYPQMPPEYIKAMNRAFMALLNGAEATDWKFYKTVNNVDIHTQEMPGTNVNSVRGTG